MSDAVVDEKLESLRRCLERVRTKLPDDVETFVGDLDAQDIVAVNLERAVQLCVDVALHALSRRNVLPPKTMADAFALLAEQGLIAHSTAARLAKAVGFRNLAVHAYRQIDWRIVHTIGTRHLDDFRQFMREVTRENG